MESFSKKREKRWELRGSLSFKVIRSVALSCALLGLLTIFISISLYGITLTREYLSLANNTAQQAHITVRNGSGYLNLTRQVMTNYHSVSEEEKDAMSPGEYRALFADIEQTAPYQFLKGMIQSYTIYTDVFDVYIAIPDEENGCLVVIADANKEVRMFPGDRKEVPKSFREPLRSWDRKGELGLYSRLGKGGLAYTVALPLPGGKGAPDVILFVDVTLRDMFNELLKDAVAILLAVLVVTLVILWLHARRMKKRWNMIANAAQTYISDKRSGSDKTSHFASLNIHTGDEMENLSRTMADMEEELVGIEETLTRATAENERISTELELASRIQENSVPNVFPPFPDHKEFEICATMHPAKEVGGDFYDFFLLDEEHLGLVIADVSGKGVPAALFMMISKMLVQNYALIGGSPREVLEMVNSQLIKNNPEKMFVTIWLGILALKTGHLTAANAGHEYPVMKRPDGMFELIRDRHGLFVGAKGSIRYTDYELQLEKGAKLFVYTDGVPEAMDADKKMFGMDRMLKSLREAEDGAPQEILAHVRRSIDSFVGDAPQFDDITMLCLSFNGPELPVKEISFTSFSQSIPEAAAFVEEELIALDCPADTLACINIAVDEIMSNICRYAYVQGSGPVTVRVEPTPQDRGAVITFIDRGITYNPLNAPDPDVTLSPESRKVGGLGIFLVKKLMDFMTYDHVDGRNILRVTKKF